MRKQAAGCGMGMCCRHVTLSQVRREVVAVAVAVTVTVVAVAVAVAVAVVVVVVVFINTNVDQSHGSLAHFSAVDLLVPRLL
jgi:hypothetical protein